MLSKPWWVVVGNGAALVVGLAADHWARRRLQAASDQAASDGQGDRRAEPT